MKDPRIAKLANNLLTHSTQLKKGERVIISATPDAKDLVVELVNQIYARGAFPIVRLGDEDISRAVMTGMTEDLSKLMCDLTMPMFKNAQVYIGISGGRNQFADSDVPSNKKVLHAKHFGRPLCDYRCANLKWVGLNWANPSLAQMAQMSTEAYTDFFFDVCCLDYGKMHTAMKPLQKLMEKTDKVRIVAPDTDLTFSIKGNKAVICSGENNVPGGECFTAPIRESLNGTIKFNIPSIEKGITHNDIYFEFRDGKIINASSSNTQALLAELDSDAGARYMGEFAFGVNPYIKQPTFDTLFDEKMAGSIHMAVGNGYPETYGKGATHNKSQVHWDIILKGGEIYFDGVLIRKDGKFIPKELHALNASTF